MTLLEAIVLGIVQGLTEFLPISSTAHLRVVPAAFGWEDPGAAFTAVTQLGSLAAVVWFFRSELASVAGAWLLRVSGRDVAGRERDARLGRYLVIGTVPLALLGLLFTDAVEEGARNLTLVGWSLILFGLALLAADHWGLDRDRRARSAGATRFSSGLGRHSPSSRVSPRPARRSPPGSH